MASRRESPLKTRMLLCHPHHVFIDFTRTPLVCTVQRKSPTKNNHIGHQPLHNRSYRAIRQRIILHMVTCNVFQWIPRRFHHRTFRPLEQRQFQPLYVCYEQAPANTQKKPNRYPAVAKAPAPLSSVPLPHSAHRNKGI